MHLPEGFSTVTPYFFVAGAERFIDFLINAFGGSETGRTLSEDGRIANAMVRIGTNSVMLSEAREPYPPMPGSFYLYVEDADETVQKALDHGAALEMTVADMPYGDRQGGVRDPFGNLWWISERLSEEPYH